MPGFAVDGIISGLDTTSLINSLMQAEAMPQTALKNKVTDANAVISAYQSVNARFAALQTAAEGLDKADTWTAVAASSSDASVSVTADATASAGALSFRVTSTAVGQISVSATDVPLDNATTFTGYPIDIRDANGVTLDSVTPTSGSLADVVMAINGAAATTGVKAVAVLVAPATATTSASYRLQLTSSKVGAQSAFSVNDSFATSAGFGAPLQDAKDAVVHVGPAAGGYDVRSNSNTFTGVLPGLTFTVSKTDVDVTLSTARNPVTLADKVQAFVDAANAALTEIGKQTAYNSTSKSGGVLLGDSGVRALQSGTLNGVSQAVTLPGPPPTSVSPASVGIETDRSGKMTFDRTTFLALQAADPTQAQALVQGVAGRLAAVAKGAADKTTGTLTLAVQGRNDLVKDLTTRINDWDDRLALRKGALQRQFSAMEVALSTLKSQSSWLAAQVASLPTPA